MQTTCPHCGAIQITANYLDNVAYGGVTKDTFGSSNVAWNNGCANNGFNALVLTANMQPVTYFQPLANVAYSGNSYQVVVNANRGYTPTYGETFAPRKGVEPDANGVYTWTLGE